MHRKGPVSQWEPPPPNQHIHSTLSPLCKLLLRALNNNGVTRATRQVWSMVLALINRAQRGCAVVCVCVILVSQGFFCCRGIFFVSSKSRRCKTSPNLWLYVCIKFLMMVNVLDEVCRLVHVCGHPHTSHERGEHSVLTHSLRHL